MWEYATSIFTTVFGWGGVALFLGAIAAAVYARPLVPYLAVAAVVCGALGYVDRLQDDLDAAQAALTLADAKLDAATAEAKRLAATAQTDADAAKRLAADNEEQAKAYEADADQARSDRDQLDLASRAAAIAAEACRDMPPPLVDPAIHSALRGKAVSEDDPLAPSMRAVMRALQTKPTGRRK